MNKWKIVVLGIISIIIFVIIYQQHQTILKYRQIPYYSLEKLAYPIEQVIEIHENETNYKDDERKQILEDLYVEFTTIYNQAGVGITTEPKIRNMYYDVYIDARTGFFVYLDKYLAATTLEQREKAYETLKSKYEEYQIFLEQARVELILHEPTEEER